MSVHQLSKSADYLPKIKFINTVGPDIIQTNLFQACAKFQLLGIFFKTNVTQGVAELILNSQKTRNWGHFYQIW